MAGAFPTVRYTIWVPSGENVSCSTGLENDDTIRTLLPSADDTLRSVPSRKANSPFAADPKCGSLRCATPTISRTETVRTRTASTKSAQTTRLTGATRAL